MGVSIGIAIAPTDAADPDQLLKNADLALYRAKTDGRGTHRFFEPQMDALMQARHAMEVDLRKALLNDEFELHYQPVVNLETQEISSFEALIRWNHPQRGRIAPLDFIPLAEETALIVPIGEWVLRRACAEAVNWPDHIGVAVNLSPAQFKMRNLSLTVMSALAQSGLPAHRLELEITEAVLLVDNASHAGDAASAAQSGCADRDGRLRHRILVAQLPAQLPVRQDQDRSVVRARARFQRGLRRRSFALSRGWAATSE